LIHSGYGPYSKALAQYLKKEFGDLITVNQKMDTGITGELPELRGDVALVL